MDGHHIKPRMSWLFEAGLWLCLLIAMAGTGTVVYWTVLERPPLRFVSRITTTPEVPIGGDLVIISSSAKSADCPVNSLEYIVDSRHRVFDRIGGSPTAGWNTADGQIKQWRFVLQIPDEDSGIALGQAEHFTVVRYRCNPLREHIVRSPTVHFDIVPKSPGHSGGK